MICKNYTLCCYISGDTLIPNSNRIVNKGSKSYSEASVRDKVSSCLKHENIYRIEEL